jgi:hypothetical protein
MSATKFLTIEETNELIEEEYKNTVLYDSNINDDIELELELELETELLQSIQSSSSSDNDNNDNNENNINKSDIENDNKSKSKPIKKKTKTNNDKSKNDATSKNNEKIKKQQQKFDFKIKKDVFTDKELSIKPEQIFIKHSKVTNPELVKYAIIKHKVFPYVCMGKSCPTAKTCMWRRKTVYLILFTKNGIERDYRPNNIMLMCPNCYCLEYGPQSFEKHTQTFIKKCNSCGYKLNSDRAKTTNYCYVCDKKIKELSQNNVYVKSKEQQEQMLQNMSEEQAFQREVERVMNSEDNLLSQHNKALSNGNSDNMFSKYGLDKDAYEQALKQMSQMNVKAVSSRNKSKQHHNGNSRAGYKYKSSTTPHITTSKNNIGLSLNISNLDILDDELNAL